MYLTFWVFLLVVFHKISSKIFSLSFLTFMVMFIGLYISYINPRKFYLQYDKYNTIIITGYTKFVIDIYFHISIFFFIYFNYGIEPFFNNWKTIPSILLVILYILIFCPAKIYHLPQKEILIVSFVSLLSYLLLFSIVAK